MRSCCTVHKVAQEAFIAPCFEILVMVTGEPSIHIDTADHVGRI